ncbi:MAG: MG2 domain-containing protein [Planctomycetaceae bacterium]|nr:MG2 domain-containing protein [Planctomycetaceae bacterium]
MCRFCLPLALCLMLATTASANHTVESAQRLANEGLYKDAYDLLQPWLLDSDNGNQAQFGQGLQIAVESLQYLTRINELDDLLESAADAHKNSWRAITSIANQYRYLPNFGLIIDNTFERGGPRGGPIIGMGGGRRWVQTGERDRVRSLQLLQEVMPFVHNEENKEETVPFFQSLAEGLMMQSQRGGGWRLQILTDLNFLPDYHNDIMGGWSGSSGAPVDAEGNPVLYHLPESWETAQNDGERWRWALEQTAKADPKQQNEVWRQQAEFYQSQFGEQTLQAFPFFGRTGQEPETTASILNLETLTDEEMIAKLATGIKRFTLPDEFNHIKLYQKIGDELALTQLAEIAKNRRQYVKAAAYFREIIEKTEEQWRREHSQRSLNQIIGNWGRFENAGSEIAGLRADLRYVFRNGKNVKLSVQEINVEQLVADIKEYIKSRPNQLDWERIQIDQIGQQLFYGNEERREASRKYLGDVIKSWEIALEPADRHFDRSTTIRFEHETAGAFLIRATMLHDDGSDGNVESAVIWLHDTAIVRKNIDRASFYFVADAETGLPIPGANVDLFGYFVEYRSTPQNDRDRQEPTLTWTFQETSQRTDENGFAVVAGNDDRSNRFNTLITVTVPERKGVSHLGFANLWTNPRHDSQHNVSRAFFISDRPVYRPLDTVNIKTWVGTARYTALNFEEPNANEWAGRAVRYEINDPRGEKIAERNVILDEYGGMETKLALPRDAMLGVYHFRIHRDDNAVIGNGTFRVEEYRTPEYEVVIEAPKEPISLGDTITATIRANYYFGSPVSEATVKYKVLRERAITDWFPIRPWDWFYGSGYGWFAYDAEWLPGWARWGIRRPTPPWLGGLPFGRYSGPPEVVAEVEVPINPDGTVDVVIDTAIAKEMFPNDSQRYTITAEVIDNSRRTIVGTGTVLVAKEPFRVFAWVDRGFYTPEQKIAASFQTRRLDGKPVSGEGMVKVFRLTYEDGNGGGGVSVVETEVHSAAVLFDANGRASLDLTAAAPGQYRISCVIEGQEGGYVFNVYNNEPQSEPRPGNRGSDGDWQYNALELIPEREEYAPGENVVLRVNANRENSMVLLFVRPTNGIAPGRPQVLRLDGKSAEVSIPVIQGDMPNFFVEALTVSNGKVVNEVKEIVVPPQQRILNVEIRPNAEIYKPGGKMTADLIVTDLDGKPVVGQIAVTIYDRAVEYISGGSNVGDIKEFFWKWRRNHRPQLMTNLDRFLQRFVELSDLSMENLGIFGHIGMPESGMDGAVYTNGMAGGRLGVRAGSVMARGMSGMGMGGGMAGGMPMPASAPMQESVVSAESAQLVGGIARNPDVMADSGGGAFIEPTVRTNFADTALWIGTLETNAEGIAQIELDMPESLTTWKVNVWTLALGTRVGHGNAEVITRKDFIIRMQTPRFLIEKDKVVFSANVHNYLAEEKTAAVTLEVGENAVQFIDESTRTQTVKIPANGEIRVDWLVEARSPLSAQRDGGAAGDAVITMKALTDEESDAMQRTLPVYVHGMLKQDSYSAFIAPTETSASFDVRVPAERKPEQTKLTVQFSPSLAFSMIDALPYLVDYPYGCTEQTLNRFLPTVIVHKVIGDGWDLREKENPGWAIARSCSPVFDREQIDDMVRDGVTRLVNMQYPDGGWGWFSGHGGSSSAHLTALVVRGLHLAQSNGAAVPEDVLRRGIDWLKRYQASQVVLLRNAAMPDKEERRLPWKEQADEVDAFVFMVLAEMEAAAERSSRTIDGPTADMMEFLQRDRGKLALYGVAMTGIGESLLPGDPDERQRRITPYVRILEQYLVQDDANQTAYLNLRAFPNWRWWNWYGSEFETQAYYLRLLMRADPESPVAPRLVKYLLNNRKHATYWNSTRDTAIVIEAFAEYLEATGEGKPAASPFGPTEPYMTVEVLVNGEVKKTVALTPENFLVADNALVLEGDEVATGTHKVELRVSRAGAGGVSPPVQGNAANPLYITAFLENFTLEDPIEKAGLEVNIERRIYKLVRDESATATVAGGRGQAVDLQVERYNRVVFDGDVKFESGDLVEVELIIESRNDYESLIIEDWKAAGLEPVDLRSGYTGNELGAYVEFRDERVAFFVYRLARGRHSLTYRLRAETPGEFSALPARIAAMYAPELRGNSDEDKVQVQERPADPADEARRIAIEKVDEVGGVNAHLRYNVTVRERPEEWSVFFDGKVPTPGDHATVLVNKATGEARFIPGR